MLYQEYTKLESDKLPITFSPQLFHNKYDFDM